LLWQALKQVPENYREPLVLFYREGQSTERVAQALDLTEDAVRQRLSRGRTLLREQLLGLIEGALKRTSPGKAFTVGVLAALPAVGTTAKAATAAGTATMASLAGKSSSVAGAWLIAPLSAIFGAGSRFGSTTNSLVTRSNGSSASVSPCCSEPICLSLPYSAS
jgi:hypothetical protein